MDPFEVLGLPRGAPADEVRARYHALARQHHPDKLTGLPPDELARHEAIFKEVTAAYRATAQSSTDGAARAEWDTGDWRRMWSTVEEKLKQAARTVREEARAAQRAHRLTLAVTLADVQHRRKRKVLLNLKDRADPVLVEVDCGDFPEWRAPAGTASDPVVVSLRLADTGAYRCESFQEGVHDLFWERPVSLADALEGGVAVLPPLEAQAAPLAELAFAPLAERLELRDATLWRLGAVYVTLPLAPPSADKWAALPAEERAAAVAVFRKLG
jgi:hypothetical protein